MKLKLPFAAAALCFAITLVTPAHAQHMNAGTTGCEDAGANVDMSNCFYSSWQKADAELNRVYNRIMRVMPTEDRPALVASQRNWIRFRDSFCAVESGLYSGGSAEGMVRSACLAALTTQQISSLRNAFWWRVEKFDSQ